MATAFYSLGMVNEFNQANSQPYRSWKGTGLFSNPINIASGNLRPLTNLDPANSAPAKFGLPRPIKHYRRGRSTVIRNDDIPLIERQYYSNRIVRSSVPNDLISQSIGKPGSIITRQQDLDCRDCKGITMTDSYMPSPYLTENPLPKSMNTYFCCNAETKALKRVLPASTLLKKNYFTTTYQKLYNRCQTFEQRQFNFLSGAAPGALKVLANNPLVTKKLFVDNIKPGDPLSNLNIYVANCSPAGPTISLAIKYLFINKIIKLWQDNNIISEDESRDLILSTQDINDLINTIKKLPDIGLQNLASKIYTQVYNNANIQNILPSLNYQRACSRVYYKPNNPRYAQQGAVSSATRTLFTITKTIETNLASLARADLASVTKIYSQNNTIPEIPFIYKNKVPRCNPSLYSRNGNSKICFTPYSNVARF